MKKMNEWKGIWVSLMKKKWNEEELGRRKYKDKHMHLFEIIEIEINELNRLYVKV